MTVPSPQPRTSVTTSVPLGPAARQGNTAFAVSVALLLLRLTLGWAFIYHGSQLALGAFGGPGVAAFGESLSKMGLPDFLPPIVWAYLAAYAELLGGISVMLGLLARLGALSIIATMLVAIVQVHARNGYDLGHGGYEYNLLILAVCVTIVLAGPGIISLDALIFRQGFWARGAQPLGDAVPRAAVR